MLSPDAAIVMRNIGRRVAELRQAREWTQEMFAERAGVTVGYVRRVEGGRGNLTVSSLVRFAALLDVEVTGLFVAPASAEAKRGRPRKT